jgi:dolichol-phosphate mannosyltransferase
MVWFDSMIRDVVCVLLPTLDESQTIGKVIDDIPTGLLKSKGYDVDIVVVDGNSTDGTREIAKAKGVRLITQDGAGKGNALRSAFREFDGVYPQYTYFI